MRREVLQAFLARPGLVRHASALAREIGRPPEVVARELRRLELAGVLTSEQVGRARRYRVAAGSPFWKDFARIAQKTIGVEMRLRQALADLIGIEAAFIFGSYARGDERPTSDLDLFVVGDVARTELRARLQDVECDLGRDVNLVHYRGRELRRLSRGSAFLREVLSGPKVMLFGDVKRALSFA